MATQDYFDRQKRIPEWNQELIEKQVAFCLGVGGLGTSVALNLCRLGVKKIYLLDKDVVDHHNLNRQVLFSKEHIGKSKVQSALETLKELHNLRTEIVPMDMDALTNWDQVVKASEDCTVLFNMIDVGDYFDAAVQSLALVRGIPMVLGGTFQTIATIDVSNPKGKPCWLCLSPLSDHSILTQLLPANITSLKSIDFIPRDAKPVGASTVYVASTCANLMTSVWVQSIHGQSVPNRSILYFNTMEIDKWVIEPEAKCLFCADKTSTETTHNEHKENATAAEHKENTTEVPSSNTEQVQEAAIEDKEQVSTKSSHEPMNLEHEQERPVRE